METLSQFDKQAEKTEKEAAKPSENLSRATSDKAEQRDVVKQESERIEKSASGLPGVELKKDDGSTVQTNEKGQVTKVTDASGTAREFKYGADGKINEVKEPSGTWKTTDGVNWTNEKGERWKGTVDVAKDGTYSYTDGKGIRTTKETDGETVIRERSGGTRKLDASGKLVETVDANGQKREFAYGADGRVNKVTEPDGKTWQTKDGYNWQTSRGDSWQGTVSLDGDGTYSYVDAAGNLTINRVDGRKETVNRAEMEQAASQIRKATEKDDWVDTGTDEDAIFNALDGKSEAQRKMMNDIYKARHGVTLEEEMRDEMGGSDLDKGLRLLHRKDPAPEHTPPGVDRAKMEEAAKTIRKATEKDDFVDTGTDEDAIKNVLKDKTEDERKVIDEIYRERYGTSLAAEFADEMSGDDLHDAMRLLNRKDGESADGAENLKAKTDEQKQADAQVDRAAMEERVKAIRKATEKDDFIDTGTDEDAIYKALEGTTESERRVMNEIYQEKYNTTLEAELRDEMSDEDLVRGLSLLHKKDLEVPAGVDMNELEKSAEGIYKACNEGWGGIGTNKDAIKEILRDKTEAERKIINDLYKEKYGMSLEEEFVDEMEGHDLDECMRLLNRKDGDADDAGRIHTALVERDQTFFGRSDATCEKDIRDTLATMNSEQIEKLDQDYRERYGKGIRDALMDDPNLSQATKDAIEIYLKGSDKRTDDDTLKLADIALKEEDIDMFQEAMRDASPEARQRFKDGGGDARMREAFSGIFSDADLYHAREYAEKGGLKTSTKIRDNTSWMGDNEKAIEQALAEMTPEERKAYLDGKRLANNEEIPNLTEEEKQKALETYRDINSALHGAGNDTEVAKWEDIIYSGKKEGSLVTELTNHKGYFDDDESGVYKSLEDMSKEDWERLKKDPTYRQQIENALGTFMNESELKRAKDILDKKETAETYEEAQASGRRSIIDAIKDNQDTFNDDEDSIIDAISKMSPEEQQKYRDDPDFRKQVQDTVKDALDSGAEQDAAFRMLDKIERGEKPTQDIVSKLNMHATHWDTDEAEVIRDIQKAFREDPTLRERLNNPQTPEDQRMAIEFDKALRRALDDDEYNRYAKPLLEDGFLSAEKQMELNKGVFNDDEQGFYKDLIFLAEGKDPASQAERQKILTDEDYQKKVLGALSEDEKKVALYALEQGKMLPEDVIRSHLIGAGTGEEEVKAALRNLTPEQKEQLKRDYARKYGEDLTYSLLDEMGGQDAVDAKRLVRREAESDREAFNLTRDEFYESRDGIGKWWVDNVWDGTGYMADNALNDFAKSMSKASAEFRELSPEEQKRLTEQVQANLDLFRESKGAAADMAVDAVIIAAALLAAKFTGGLSLGLLAKTALAGAVFKVAAKSTIMGQDYDWASSQVVVDSLTGAVDAATIVVGPAQLAQVFKMGEKAAATAATKLIAEGGEGLIKAGARETVGKRMFELVAKGISEGCEGVPDKAIKKLAQEIATDGNVEAVEALIKKNLQEALEAESKGFLKNTLREVSLNSGAGVIGGGGSGAIRGGAEWDTSKSISENLKMISQSTFMGAAMGAGMAGVFTVGFKGLGVGWKAFRGAGPDDIPGVRPDMDAVVNGHRLEPGEMMTFGRSNFDGAPADVSSKHLSLARDTDGRMLLLDHSDGGTFIKRAGSDKFEKVPFGEPTPVRPGDEIRVGSETGPKVDLEAKAKGSELPPPRGDEPPEIYPIEPKAVEGPQGRPVDGGAPKDAELVPSRSGPDAGLDRSGNEVPSDRTQSFGLEWLKGKLGMGGDAAPPPPQNPHATPSTAPRRGPVQVEGRPLGGDEVVLGRNGDIRVGGSDEISRRHAAMRIDEQGRTVLRDLDSTNGTYVNGRKIEGEVVLKPGDKVTLGRNGPEVKWGQQLEPTYHANLGGNKLEVQPGQEIPLHRTKPGAPQGEHARLGMDEKGLYIIERTPSTDGTFVNGTRIKPGEKVYLNPADDVHLGSQKKVWGQPEGEALSLMPSEVMKVGDDFVPPSRKEFQKAVDQSNEMALNHQIREPLKDGWQNAGMYNEFNLEGQALDNLRPRNAVVVDRANDPVLRQVIQEARDKFGHLPPKQRAEALTDYVNKLLKPEGMSESSLDDWYDAFSREHMGERVHLGEYIRQGKGVCSQQATLLKVLGDELGLDVTLVRGTGDPSLPNQINHQWVHINLPGENQPLIYDPRWGIKGGKYGDVPAHTPGLEVMGERAGQVTPLKPKDTIRPPADVVLNGRKMEVPEDGLKIGRQFTGTVDASHPKFGQVSADHATVTAGPDGRLYITDNSSFGTYVNGQKIKSGEAWPLRPTDRITLGAPDGPELQLSPKAKPPADVVMNGKPVALNNGDEIPIGRKHGNIAEDHRYYDRVSGDHGILKRDGDGNLFIRDTSRNGIYVNGERIPRGEDFPIGPNDRVTLGRADGPEVNLKPRAVTEAADSADTVIIQRATADSPVIKGPDGKVRETLDAQGNRHMFLYDDNGRLQRVHYPNGNKAERTGDGVWRITDASHADGKYNWHGEISVGKDGSIWQQAQGGDMIGHKLDGKVVVQDRFHGVRVHAPDGKILNTMDTKGRVTQFGYGADGRLNKISFASGATAESADGVTWKVTDLSRPEGEYTWKGTAQVDSDGSLRWRAEGGGETTYRPDGSRINRDVHGIQKIFNVDNQLTATVDGAGRQTRYGYDAAGQLRKITYPNGNTAEALDGGSWRITDPSHPEGGYVWRGKATLDSDGTMRWKADGGGEQLVRPDGSRVVMEATGGARVHGTDGKITATRNTSNEITRYGYDESGQLSEVTLPGGSKMTRTGDEAWHVADSTHPDGGYTWNGKISLDSGGDLHWKAAGGDDVVIKLDGSRVINDRMGGVRHVSIDGKVTHTTDASGRTLKFGYGEDGLLTRVEYPNGTRAERGDGNNWLIIDASHPQGKYAWKGELNVDATGTFKQHAEGGDVILNKLDGTREIQDRMGGTRFLDSSGKITRTSDTRGISHSFEYGNDGQLVRVVSSNGIETSSRNGIDWTVTDPFGGRSSFRGRLSLDSDGTMRYKIENGPELIYRLNGKAEMHGQFQAQVKVGNNSQPLEVGQEIPIGRQHQRIGDGHVSRNHATLGRDEQGLYVIDNNSTHGTWVRHQDGSATKVKAGEKTRLNPGDELRLGGAEGYRVEATLQQQTFQPQERGAWQQWFAEKFRPPKPVELRKESVDIGSNHLLPDGRPTPQDGLVSPNHGKLRWDEKQKAFFFTDTSQNGTFIKREGADHFVLVSNKEVKLGPRDEIRLGSPDGPRLNLAHFKQPDSVPFRSAGDAQIYIGENRLPLGENGTLKIGRDHKLGESGGFIDDLRVSRDHGTLRFNDSDKSFYYRDHSSQGTYIKREGSEAFELVKDAEVKVGPRDEIRLGSPDGPQLDLVGRTRIDAIAAAEKEVGRQAFFKGQELDLGDGKEVVVGRQVSLVNQSDLVDRLVSQNHGVVKMDDATGQIVYRDTSRNGTYIKRAGSDEWEIVHRAETRINPGDEVRLGSQNGPELKLHNTRGQDTPDGAIQFRRPEGDVWHNPDGRVTFSDRAGIFRWTDADGKITDVKDGFGVHRKYSYDANGRLNKIEHSNGWKVETKDGLNWTKTAPDGTVTQMKGRIELEPDGSLKVFTESEPPTIHRLDGAKEILHPNGRIEYADANLPVERQRLASLSDAHFSNPEQKARFAEYARRFESRAQQLGLSEKEIALTYHQVTRLIQAGADAPIPQAQRVRLAEQILSQAANPHSIDQGFNNTCNVTTVENRIFTRNPAEAARLITDVATTGKYVTVDGHTVDLGRVQGALRPDAEARMSLERSFDAAGHSDIKVDGRRSYASQIFEMTAVNVKYARSAEFKQAPGEVVMYERGFDRVFDRAQIADNDTGERLYRYAIGPDGRMQRIEVARAPELNLGEMADIHNQITGTGDSQFIIHGPGTSAGGAPDAAIKVTTPHDLEMALMLKAAQQDMPLILMVHTGQPPFAAINDAGAGGRGGWHVVNIQGIRRSPPPPQGDGKLYVEFTNQWGSHRDHLGDRAVPVDVLFGATKEPPKPVVASSPAGGGGT